jgi:hypothetical protein
MRHKQLSALHIRGPSVAGQPRKSNESYSIRHSMFTGGTNQRLVLIEDPRRFLSPPRLAELRVVKTADRFFDGRSSVRRTKRPAADLRHRSPMRLADALTRRASILSPLSCFAQRAVDNAATVDEGADSVCRGLMFKLVATTGAPRRVISPPPRSIARAAQLGSRRCTVTIASCP